MAIIYEENWMNKKVFEASCQKAGKKPKEVVFIFPGNPGHHTINDTLFSIKKGDRLGEVAENLGKEGYPVLSLPTTHMDGYPSTNNKHNVNTDELAKKAVADLYRAAGAGFDLMLPVRPYGTQYFPSHLKHANIPNKVEPRFWGGVQTAPNLALASYYLDELNKLDEFLKLSPEDQEKKSSK